MEAPIFFLPKPALQILVLSLQALFENDLLVQFLFGIILLGDRFAKLDFEGDHVPSQADYAALCFLLERSEDQLVFLLELGQFGLILHLDLVQLFLVPLSLENIATY